MYLLGMRWFIPARSLFPCPASLAPILSTITGPVELGMSGYCFRGIPIPSYSCKSSCEWVKRQDLALILSAKTRPVELGMSGYCFKVNPCLARSSSYPYFIHYDRASGNGDVGEFF